MFRKLLMDAEYYMLEIRMVSNQFVVFDADTEEGIMRFDNQADASDLVLELMISDSFDRLEARKLSAAQSKFCPEG